MEKLTRDEIRKVFKYFDDENFEAIYKIIGHEEFNSFNIEDLSEEEEEKLATAILEKIDRNDFDYIIKDLKQASLFFDIVTGSQLDGNLCIEIVKKYKEHLDGFQLVEMIKRSKNTEFIKECVEKNKEYGVSSLYIFELIKATNDSDFIKDCIENYKEYDLSDGNKDELILATKDFKYIKNCIKTNPNCFRYRLEDKIKIFKNDENTLDELVQEIADYRKSDIIRAYDNPEFTKKCVFNEDYGLKTSQKVELISLLNDESSTEKLILESKDMNINETNFLLDSLDRKKRLNVLNSLSDQVDEKIIIEYRKNTQDYEFLKENIDFFMKKEKIDDEQIQIKKEYLIKMFKDNNEVVGKIDFRMLEPKYIENLGLDIINQISCYQDVQKQVLELNETQLKVFAQCIENSNNVRWTPLAQMFLQNSSQYNELIENIAKAEEGQIDYKKINLIIQDENIFQIKSLEDVENFEQIRRDKCDEWIKSDVIEEKKLAVLEKIYGQSLEYSKTLITKYGQDIDSIQDGELKDYIQSINAIIELEDEKVIEEIYEKCQEVENIDKINIEQRLKNEYFKLYNEDLFTIDNSEQIEEGIYDAGTEFKMIITSLGAFHNEDIDDYQKSWNRPAIGSQHFCCSYIRNDLIHTAPISNICYRFLTNVK